MAAFIRVANERICSVRRTDSSLRELGLYSMLSAFLSNPDFRTAYGGMQSLLMRHCRNRYFSLHSVWKKLEERGFLKRTRIPSGLNCFHDYYELKLKPDDTPSSQCLTVEKSKEYLSSYHPFSEPKDDFTMISYPMLMDSRLSLSAKGLYAVIARILRISDYREDVAVTKDTLRNLCHEGFSAFNAAFRELRELGYLTLSRIRGAAGASFRYCLHESGATEIEKSTVQSPDPYTGKRNSYNFPQQKDGSQNEPTLKIAPPPSETSIKDQIEYSVLSPEYPRARLETVVSVMQETMRLGYQSPLTELTMGRGSLRAAEAAERMRKLTYEDVRYALDRYGEISERQPIRHPRAYLLSCLCHAKEDYTAVLDAFHP